MRGLGVRGLGVRGLGVRGLGVRGLGVRGLGVRGLGVRGLGVRGLGVTVNRPKRKRDMTALLAEAGSHQNDDARRKQSIHDRICV